MGLFYLDPNSNNTSVWSINAYTNVAKGVRSPSIPIVSTYIEAIGTDDSENQSYNMETDSIPAGYYISQITSYHYAWTAGVVPNPTVYSGIFGLVGKTLSLSSSQGWRTVSWTGLSIGEISQSDIDNCKMQVQTGTIADKTYIRIAAMYMAFTTSIIGPSTVASRNGTSAINIDSINGTNWEDIDSINGMT